MSKNDVRMALTAIKASKAALNRQQMLTLRGQVLAGDIIGAMRGLQRIVGGMNENGTRERSISGWPDEQRG